MTHKKRNLRHIHLVNNSKNPDPNKPVQVECNNEVCWAIGKQLGNRITG